MKLSPEDKAFLTAEEIALLEASDADEMLLTHGDTPAKADAEPEDAQQDEAPEEITASADEPTGQADDNNEDAAVEAEDAPQAPTLLKEYEVKAADDFATRKAALKTEKRGVEERWASGELSDDERAAQLEEIDDKLFTLVQEQTRADTLREINEQNARAAAAAAEKALNDATMAVIKAAKKAGTIDYVTDTEAQAQFDTALAMLERSASWKGKSPAEMTAQAHKTVLALRGIAAPAPAPQAKAATATREVPMTLSGLPSAARVGVEDELMQQVATLSGPDLEQFLAGLPAGKLDRAMRAIDSMAIGR